MLNRAQIIDDLFYFAMEKKSNFILFWKLKNYLSRETDYVAWYPVIKVFEYLSTFISFSEIKLKVSSDKFRQREYYIVICKILTLYQYLYIYDFK